jgi:hypothetical protein
MNTQDNGTIHVFTFNARAFRSNAPQFAVALDLREFGRLAGGSPSLPVPHPPGNSR